MKAVAALTEGQSAGSSSWVWTLVDRTRAGRQPLYSEDKWMKNEETSISRHLPSTSSIVITVLKKRDNCTLSWSVITPRYVRWNSCANSWLAKSTQRFHFLPAETTFDIISFITRPLIRDFHVFFIWQGERSKLYFCAHSTQRIAHEYGYYKKNMSTGEQSASLARERPLVPLLAAMKRGTTIDLQQTKEPSVICSV